MIKKIYDLFDICDGVMITSPENLRYFSGFSGGEGICIISNGCKAILVDSRYTVAAKEECADFEVIEYTLVNLYDKLNTILKDNKIGVLLIEDKQMTVFEFNNYKKKLCVKKIAGTGNRLEVIRAVKTEEEIKNIAYAEKIGDIAFKNVLPFIKEGVTENEIAAEIEYQMRKNGAKGTSFETIVVSGYKTAMPHGVPSDKKIQNGEFLTLDFGCIYNGYCSDMTRTVAIGYINSEFEKIYSIVYEAQEMGLHAIKSGAVASRVDKAARDVIEGYGYGKNFGHSLGHGVGLKIHEQPVVSPRSDTVLLDNMVVSCEPGIYVEGLGGVRIEDLVVVKGNMCLNLTSSPKNLIVCG